MNWLKFNKVLDIVLKLHMVCKKYIVIYFLCYINLKWNSYVNKKQFIKTKPVCKVTFSVEAKEATEASVIGDFNNWNQADGALSKLKNGTFKGVFNIEKDASYEFKYIIDGAFVNEAQADSFLWNEYAGNENGVLTV